LTELSRFLPLVCAMRCQSDTGFRGITAKCCEVQHRPTKSRCGPCCASWSDCFSFRTVLGLSGTWEVASPKVLPQHPTFNVGTLTSGLSFLYYFIARFICPYCLTSNVHQRSVHPPSSSPNRRLLARHSLPLGSIMLYNALLSLALAVATEGLKQRETLNHDLQTRGDVSEGLTKRTLQDRLPLAGPFWDRINVPGRPRWRGQGNTGSSPDYPYLFAAPLPIPDVARPIFTETVNGVPIDY